MWWDAVKTAPNVIAMVLAAAFGWLINRLSKMDDTMGMIDGRITNVEKDLVDRTQTAATNIAVLQSYHQSNLQRLDAIDGKANDINAKLDTLIWNMANRRTGNE